MRIKPYSVEWRLMKWGEWVQNPPELSPWPSVFGKIYEEQDNAGARGDGLIYEIIDGVPCPPDGGLSAAYERSAKRSTWDIQCRDVNRAVNGLPKLRREIVRATYIVSTREEPRGVSAVAALLDLDRSNVHKSLELAHQYIASQIFDRFVIVEPSEVTKAA